MTKEGTDSSSTPNTSVQNLSYNDNSPLVITNHKLDGKNFLQWSQSVLMVIRGRGKLGYLTGDIPRPDVNDKQYDTWELNNSIVMAWLINSMEINISRTYLLFKTAKAIWEAVNETYSDLGNASQVFEIKMKLKDIRQGTTEVTRYYNCLKVLWQELDMFYEADWGEGDHVRFKAHLEKECLYDFLAGLNRDLDEVRGRILGRTPLPSIGEAFAEVRREENRRRVMLGEQKEVKSVTNAGERPLESSALATKGSPIFKPRQSADNGNYKSGERPWCNHCNRAGHTREKCFKIHGYPGTNKTQPTAKAHHASTEASSSADEVMNAS